MRHFSNFPSQWFSGFQRIIRKKIEQHSLIATNSVRVTFAVHFAKFGVVVVGTCTYMLRIRRTQTKPTLK